MVVPQLLSECDATQMRRRYGAPVAVVSWPLAVPRRFLRAAVVPAAPATRGAIVVEVAVVFLVTLGTSAASALIGLAYALDGINAGSAFIVTVPGQPALSVGLASVYLVVRTAGAVGIVAYLIYRSGENFSALGFSLDSKRRDLLLIVPFGVVALTLQHAGFLLPLPGGIQGGPDALPVPALYSITAVLRSVEAGVVEEVVVLAFVVTRLRQAGLHPLLAILISALLRASYHLEYGWAAVGPLLFGVGLASMYMLTRRALPAIAVHAGYDVLIAFQSYSFG